jgi:fermentation-respiration switch protein FrsA (DUF1100 family)
MNIIKLLILAIVIAYLLFGTLLYVFQDKFTFFPTPQDFNACSTFKDSQKILFNGTRLYYTHNSARLAIVFHGNGGSACDRQYIKTVLDQHNISSIFVEYAGYSNDNSKPSVQKMLIDADNAAAYAKQLHPKQLIIVSESIGGGPATYLAKEQPDKIILISPFSRLSDVAQKVYLIYPVKLLIKTDLDNIAALRQFRGKVAIIHGTSDTIIPIELSEKLYAAIQTQKTFYKIDGAGHNDMFTFQETIKALDTELKN